MTDGPVFVAAMGLCPLLIANGDRPNPFLWGGIMEDVRPIPGYLGYWASAEGKIFCNRPTGQRGHRGMDYGLEPDFRERKVETIKGSHCVRFYVGGTLKRHTVGHVVLLAFVGPPLPGQICCHGEGGRLDDRLSNLTWGSQSKNLGEDKKRDGTLLVGEKHNLAKLNGQDIVAIRELRGVLGSPKVAALYGVDKSNICLIWQRKTWKHVP